MTLLGDRLKQLRGEATLYEVGQAIGVDRSIISRYERGVIAPQPPLLKKLAEYYEVEYKRLRTLHYQDSIKEPEEQQILLEWTISALGYPQQIVDLIEFYPKLNQSKKEQLLIQLKQIAN